MIRKIPAVFDIEELCGKMITIRVIKEE